MKKKIQCALACVVVIAAIALLAVLAFPRQNYKYEIEQEGTLFQSNYFEPKDYLGALSSQPKFIIAPQVTQGGAINSYMSQSLNLFIVILTYNSRTTVTLLRVTDEKGLLAYCQTNDGNSVGNRAIDSSECNAMLGDKSAAIVLIDLPDSSLSKSRVVLEENRMRIIPRSPNDAMRVPLLVLRAMYSNSQDVLDQINRFASKSIGSIGEK